MAGESRGVEATSPPSSIVTKFETLSPPLLMESPRSRGEIGRPPLFMESSRNRGAIGRPLFMESSRNRGERGRPPLFMESSRNRGEWGGAIIGESSSNRGENPELDKCFLASNSRSASNFRVLVLLLLTSVAGG